MHQIDTPTASAGLFQDSDTPGTQVSAAWLNDLQENLIGILIAAGIAPIKGDYTQLATALIGTSGSNGNGYWRKHPDGTIEQWGHYAGGAAAPTLTFPIEWPTACESLQTTAVSTTNSTPSSSQGGVKYASPDPAVTTTDFKVWCSADDGGPDTNQPSTTVPFYWRAIGR